jgi:hypothetical protein
MMGLPTVTATHDEVALMMKTVEKIPRRNLPSISKGKRSASTTNGSPSICLKHTAAR